MAIDLYNAQSCDQAGIPANSTFNSFRIRARCALTSTTNGQRFRTVIKTNGSEYYGSWQTPAVTQYVNFNTLYTNNPGTSNPWARSELDAIQIGVELDANGNSTTPVYGTQVYGEIDYDPPPAARRKAIANSVARGIGRGLS